MRCDAPIFLIFSVYTDLRFFSMRTFANIIVIILYNSPFPCTCTSVAIVSCGYRSKSHAVHVSKIYHEYLMSRPEGRHVPPHPRSAPIRAVGNRGTVWCGYNRMRYAKYTNEYLMSRPEGGGLVPPPSPPRSAPGIT